MSQWVTLSKLPEGVEFPTELQHRVSYHPESQRLSFEGFMSKTDFDRLLRLSNDLEYQRSLEQLFQKCTFQAAAPAASAHHPVRWLVAAAAGVGALAAAMMW